VDGLRVNAAAPSWAREVLPTIGDMQGLRHRRGVVAVIGSA
jgi:hypothetical protein